MRPRDAHAITRGHQVQFRQQAKWLNLLDMPLHIEDAETICRLKAQVFRQVRVVNLTPHGTTGLIRMQFEDGRRVR